jgi:hypothetical protein
MVTHRHSQVLEDADRFRQARFTPIGEMDPARDIVTEFLLSQVGANGQGTAACTEDDDFRTGVFPMVFRHEGIEGEAG